MLPGGISSYERLSLPLRCPNPVHSRIFPVNSEYETHEPRRRKPRAARRSR